MCYRLTSHYLVLCDRCGLTAPEGDGWTTPSYADEAALEAGWAMTMTEHLCPSCAIAAVPDDLDDELDEMEDLDCVDVLGPRPALAPTAAVDDGRDRPRMPSVGSPARSGRRPR